MGGITPHFDYRTLTSCHFCLSSRNPSLVCSFLDCSHHRPDPYHQAADMGTIAVAGDGVALYYGAIILLVLAWITFTMRVGVRIWRKAFGMDDCFMLVGIVRSQSVRYGKD